jgi:hypothetical protein
MNWPACEKITSFSMVATNKARHLIWANESSSNEYNSSTCTSLTPHDSISAVKTPAIQTTRILLVSEINHKQTVFYKTTGKLLVFFYQDHFQLCTSSCFMRFFNSGRQAVCGVIQKELSCSRATRNGFCYSSLLTMRSNRVGCVPKQSPLVNEIILPWAMNFAAACNDMRPAYFDNTLTEVRLDVATIPT